MFFTALKWVCIYCVIYWGQAWQGNCTTSAVAFFTYKLLWGKRKELLEMTIPSFLSPPALLSSHAGVAAPDLCETRAPSLHQGHRQPLHPHRPLWLLGKDCLSCGCLVTDGVLCLPTAPCWDRGDVLSLTINNLTSTLICLSLMCSIISNFRLFADKCAQQLV